MGGADLTVESYLYLRLWPLPKLLADEFQIFIIESGLFLAITVLTLPLDGSVDIGIFTLVLLIFVLVDNETFSDLYMNVSKGGW